MKIMIVVTHLLGTGHLARALRIAKAFAAAGHSAHVVSGGMPVSHMDHGDSQIWQLPPLRSDGTDFARLMDANGALADETYRTARQDALVAAFHSITPDVLMTELFPFGRRSLHREFLHLLEIARAHDTRVVCSIRDILAPPSKPEKAAFAHDVVHDYYHRVLVHADAGVITLDQSWPVDDNLMKVIKYTGFIAPDPPAVAVHTGEVIVSAGGGDVGHKLFETAIGAAALLPTVPWRVFVKDDRLAARLAASAGTNVTVSPLVPDFRQIMAASAVSVSMCGYNTALDVLQTGVPAVFVPFDEGSEVEQTLRAEALAKQPAIRVVLNAELSANILAENINSVMDERRDPWTTGMDGARETVRIVEGLL